MEAPISVKGLRKAYQGVPAVRDISFSVNPGEIFGLLGENGAGKVPLSNVCWEPADRIPAAHRSSAWILLRIAKGFFKK